MSIENLPQDQPDPDAPARLAPLLIKAWHQIAALQDELDEMEADKTAYRELAQQAIHALHDLTERHQRQTARYRELLEEHRTQRRAA